MIRRTIQVQRHLPPRQALSITEEFMLMYFRPLKSERIAAVQEAKRRYPGELEAACLLAYFESRPTFERQSFWKLLRSSEEGRNIASFNKLGSALDLGKWAFQVGKDGLVILPTTQKGLATLAILLLDYHGRLHRIRQCLQCQTWFYARSKRQRFCNDAKTKCQWNHYHTPEWRKKHRKQNRKHQRAYRKRNPGRGA